MAPPFGYESGYSALVKLVGSGTWIIGGATTVGRDASLSSGWRIGGSITENSLYARTHGAWRWIGMEFTLLILPCPPRREQGMASLQDYSNARRPQPPTSESERLDLRADTRARHVRHRRPIRNDRRLRVGGPCELQWMTESRSTARRRANDSLASLDCRQLTCRWQEETRMEHNRVTDPATGDDLDRVVREHGPLPVRQAVDYTIQAARRLETAHAQGTVHGEIKPANLRVDGPGLIHVTDPGFGKGAEGNAPVKSTAVAGFTQNGTEIGVLDYMAPERAAEPRRADHRADIYSLGCTLYFLLAGQRALPGETIPLKLIAHREEEAPSLRFGGLMYRRGWRPAIRK